MQDDEETTEAPTVTVRIEADMLAKLDEMAKRTNRTRSGLIRHLLGEGLENGAEVAAIRKGGAL